jgi:transcriptional regulator with XRE-family HTH domain
LEKEGISEKTIGERLENIRKEKNISLEEASAKLRIRKKYLKALEESDYSVFAAEVYAKGFLKNYVRFLGLDFDKYSRLFRRESYREFNNRDSPGSKPQNNSLGFGEFGKHKNISLKIIIISIVCGLLLFGFRVYQVSQKPELSISSPVIAFAGEDKDHRFDTAGEIIGFKGSIEHGNSLYLNDERVETLGFSEFEISDIYLHEGENEFVLSTKNKLGSSSQITVIVVRTLLKED